jgi:hypothetical protein
MGLNNLGTQVVNRLLVLAARRRCRAIATRLVTEPSFKNRLGRRRGRPKQGEMQALGVFATIKIKQGQGRGVRKVVATTALVRAKSILTSSRSFDLAGSETSRIVWARLSIAAPCCPRRGNAAAMELECKIQERARDGSSPRSH